jgi:predicted transcriptional regulator
MNDWIDALQKVRLRGAEEPPKGWLTIDKVAESLKFRKAQAYRVAEDLVTIGMAEKKKFRVQCGSLIRGKFHYKLK